jgi:hypothetical protein
MTASRIISALQMPPESRVDQRIPKKLLLEQSDAAQADKRLLQDAIEELTWVAAVRPTNAGIPEYRDDDREYLEIAVLSITLRDAAKPRVTELMHRAVPYPVCLIASQRGSCVLSFAHKRWSQGERGKVVIEEVRDTGPLGSIERESEEALFFDSLALSMLPRQNLYTVYQGWISRVDALEAARITGQFVRPGSSMIAEAVRKDIETHAKLSREISLLRTQAAKQKQVSRRVELNLEIKRIESELKAITERLKP